MVESNFSYSIQENTILIIDRNTGGKSVTNDIENVISSISNNEGIDPKKYNIAYRDSDGIWDGVSIKESNISFFPIRKTDKEEVLNFFKSKNTNVSERSQYPDYAGEFTETLLDEIQELPKKNNINDNFIKKEKFDFLGIDIYENGSIEILCKNKNDIKSVTQLMKDLNKELSRYTGLKNLIEDTYSKEGKLDGHKMIILNSIKEINRTFQEHILETFDKFHIDYSDTGLSIIKKVIEENKRYYLLSPKEGLIDTDLTKKQVDEICKEKGGVFAWYPMDQFDDENIKKQMEEFHHIKIQDAKSNNINTNQNSETMSNSNEKNSKEEKKPFYIGVAWEHSKEGKEPFYAIEIDMNQVNEAQKMTELKKAFTIGKFKEGDKNVEAPLINTWLVKMQNPDEKSKATHYLCIDRKLTEGIGEKYVAFKPVIHIEKLQQIAKVRPLKEGVSVNIAAITASKIDKVKNPSAKADYSLYQNTYNSKSGEKEANPIAVGWANYPKSKSKDDDVKKSNSEKKSEIGTVNDQEEDNSKSSGIGM